MKRETVKVSDFHNGTSYHEDLNGYKFIDSEVLHYDLDKSYEAIRCIVQRNSDNKYFAFKYVNASGGYNDILEQIAEEVLPRTVTETKTIVSTYYE